MGRMATDVGGTFTDLVYFDGGRLVVAKVLTTPANPSAGVLDALDKSEAAPADVDFFVHGGTTVINAITERKGARTALATTAGFRDVLEIGRGNRPDMYNLRFRSPEPFVPRRHRYEVRERLDRHGAVIEPLNEDDLAAVAADCAAAGIEALAVVFLHSYVNPAHERRAVAYLAARLPGVAVTGSHQITREWHEYERSNTVVLNSYVQPIIRKYFGDLDRALDARGIRRPYHAMQSNGGTTDFSWASDHPLTLVESGPAGGVNGAAVVGRLLGEANIIYLDIGGTTAKCSIIEDGAPKVHTDYRMERTRQSPGYPVQIPTVDIVEIGAGGGSIAWFDDSGALKVGPRSAGADPGPACYGRGGTEPTVTDAKLLTGVLDPETFAGGSLPLDLAKAREAMAKVAAGLECDLDAAAVAVIRVAEANMISALKLVSVQRGHDPREFALICSGGGGPMHAAPLGRELGVQTTIIPPNSGLFSAWGMLATMPRHDIALTDPRPVGQLTMDAVQAAFAGMAAEAADYFRSQAATDGDLDLQFSHSVDMRYAGQEHTVNFAVDPAAAGIEALLERFHAAHERAYTFSLRDTEAELVIYRLKAELVVPAPEIEKLDPAGRSLAAARRGERRVDYAEDGRHAAAVYDRRLLPIGEVIAGPCLVEEMSSTTLVHPGQTLAVDDYGMLRIDEA